MDKQDFRMLSILQDDGRISNAALARKVHLAEAPTWRRVKALEESKVIRGYRALIDQHKLGYEVTAFVHMRFASHDPKLQRAFEIQVIEIPEVLWCHNVSGQTDWLLCVVAKSLSDYGEFVSKRLRSLPGVTSIESSFSLKAIKSDGKLPVM